MKHFGTRIRFRHVVKWEFSSGGRNLIVFSYSGRGACYVHVYYRNRAQQAWVLFIDPIIEAATKLSAEIPSDDHVLRLKDVEGRVVEKQSIESLPR